MNAHTSSSPGDDFRIIDLFSPSEPTAFPAKDRETPRIPAAPRMSGELPESFVFANPLFASARDNRAD